MSSTEEKQKAHFDLISNDYATHYGDKWSQIYRKLFINRALFKNIELNGKLVLEAMCGSGEVT